MTLRHVKPGDPVDRSASTHNAFVDAALAHRAGSALGTPEGSPRQWIVQVRNTGDETMKRFDAVEILGPIITDEQSPAAFDRLVGFDVAYPDNPTGGGALAILQQPIGSGRMGRAIIFGVSPSREITVGSELHKRARFGAAGQMVSDDQGPAVIIWKSPASQSPRRAIVAVVQDPGGQSAGIMFARITLNGPDLIPNRWIYQMELVELDEEGAWEPVADADPIIAYNTVEAGNSGSGVQGNGVDVENLPAGFSIVPIGNGAILPVSGPYEGSPFGEFYTFTLANLVDGECQP